MKEEKEKMEKKKEKEEEEKTKSEEKQNTNHKIFLRCWLAHSVISPPGWPGCQETSQGAD